jgi:methylated-DNA-[protein]-cysteine S-methyltransferase
MVYELLGHSIDIESSRITESRKTIHEQLAEYGTGDRSHFELTIDLSSGFMGEVQRELCAIPYGETRTYGDVAERLDTAPIAVGQACGRNPLPIVVPCHRVVGADSLRGYMYPGLQEKLIELERKHRVQHHLTDRITK